MTMSTDYYSDQRNNPKPCRIDRLGITVQADGYAGEHCTNFVATKDDGTTFEYMHVNHPSFVKSLNGPCFTGHDEWIANGNSYATFDDMMSIEFGLEGKK
jgi:hypothetical protein